MRLNRWIICSAALTLAAAGAPRAGAAQGVTTGAITGSVTDSANTPVAGATVIAVNPATGFRSGTQARGNGLYTIQGLEAGTYTVSTRALGFAPVQRANIVVRATQSTRVDVQLARAATVLTGVTVTAARADADFGPARTGTRTDVSDSAVRRLPNLNRDLTSFVQLTPQATTNPNSLGVTSFAGQNNRYNNIQVDGLTQVDRFALSADQQIGGAASGRGLTLEAIKELQVLVSPFDVRQGNFTGGLTNVVTRNGTNRFEGSFATYYRNQSFGADDPLVRSTPFNRTQYAGSLGGPIIKDRLQFFLAGDVTRAETPAIGPYVGQSATAPTPVPVGQESIDRFASILDRYGIAAGNGQQVSNTTPLTNLFARLDFQINGSNRLVLRDNYNRNQANDFSRSTALTNPIFDLSSYAFQRRDISNSVGAQLFTSFSNGWSNEFQVGYNVQRFERLPASLAPQIVVENVPNPNGGVARLRAGTDSSSQVNELDQDILEIVDNLTIPIGAHTVTIGTRNEIYKARNFFAQNYFGAWSFANLDSLDRGSAQSFAVSGSLGGDVQARFTSGTFSGYVQDLWQVTPQLTLTGGVRADVISFFDSPLQTPEVLADFGRNTSDLPKGQLNISPRVGFNWDVTGDQRNQLRGGVGVFLGQPPAVFLSNNYTNTGRNLGTLTCDPRQGRPVAPAFDPSTTPTAACANGATLAPGAQLGTINTIDPDVRYPQVLRGTLAYDHQLPWNLIGSLEALYTYGINDFFYVRPLLAGSDTLASLGRPTVDRNGRLLYGIAATTGANAGRVTPILTSTRYSDVIDARNASGSYSYNLTAQLRRRFTGRWEASAAYTYQQARSVQDFTSSVARSNWNNGRTIAGDQYSKDVGISAFQVPHRIVATGSYTMPWQKFATDLSFIYTGQAGVPLTWTVTGSAPLNGDLNGDGQAGNDPIYVPRNVADASEIVFRQASFRDTRDPQAVTTVFTADQQAAAFDQFIDQQSCLDDHRGEILARNSCSNPWWNRLDISVRQSLPVVSTRLTLQADVFNFANLLNSDWGRTSSRGQFPQQAILTQVGSQLDAQGRQQNVFTFDPYQAAQIFRPINSVNNFYQMQISVRYAF